MDAARSRLTHEQVDALGEQIAEHATHIDAATHRLLVDIRTFDRAGGWSRQGAKSCAKWLSWRLGWTGNTAREHVRVANALASLPLIDAALQRGELSYCKVRALTRIASAENEDQLLVAAKHATGIQLEQICRKYATVKQRFAPAVAEDKERRRIARHDRDDGMVTISATLHPEEAELVWAALTRIARERGLAPSMTPADNVVAGLDPSDDRREFSRVDALIEMAEQVTRGTSPDRSPTEIVVTVPVEALASAEGDGVAAATTPEGCCLSTHAVRRLACDAGLVALLEDAAGNALSVGRKTRTIPAAMKRALIKRDKTCRYPGCCNRVYLDGHHVDHWFDGGETRLDRLLLLCKFHHRFVHEYGFRVELDELQQPRFFDERGRLIPEVAPRPASAEDSAQAIKRANAPLAITAKTALPLWDGSPPNYRWIVEDLCIIDDLH